MTLRSLLALLPFAGTAAADTTPAAPLLERLDRRVADIQEKERLPALGVLVMIGGEVACEVYAGSPGGGREGELGPASRWHLGSITKSMTATMIARLIDRGELSWDSTLGELLGARGYEIHEDCKPITIHQLITNRAGLAANLEDGRLWLTLMGEGADDPLGQRERLTRAVLAKPPAYRPGEGSTYSNLGFAIAGHVAELITGVEYEAMLQREVFEPLGMRSAGFGPPEGENDPIGHGRFLSSMGDNPAAIAPSGRAHATLADLAAFASAHIAAARGEPGDLLDQASWRKLHTPPDAHDPVYAAGWVTRMPESGERPVLFHNGSNTLWYAECWVLPEHDAVVIIATNRGVGSATRAVRSLAGEIVGAIIAGDEPETP